MTHMIDMKILTEAAARTESYQTRSGIDAVWTLHLTGLRLRCQRGKDHVERTIDWIRISTSNHPGGLLEMVEKDAVAGLGNAWRIP
jgi:hypothetical protein